MNSELLPNPRPIRLRRDTALRIAMKKRNSKQSQESRREAEREQKKQEAIAKRIRREERRKAEEAAARRPSSATRGKRAAQRIAVIRGLGVSLLTPSEHQLLEELVGGKLTVENAENPEVAETPADDAKP